MKAPGMALGPNNVRLLGVMLAASLGAFCYFPYVTTALVEFLALPSPDMAALVGAGMVAGNVLAYGASLKIPTKAMPRFLPGGYALLLIALAIMACARWTTGTATLLLAGASLVLYRFAMALTSNLARVAQLQYLPCRSAKPRLFSYIKFVTSIGGACGPVLGSLAFETAGMPAVSLLSGALFAAALSLLGGIHPPQPSTDPQAPQLGRRSLWANLRLQPRQLILLSSAGLLHHVFEAQIYATIAIAIQRNVPDYIRLVALLFTSNALLLVVLVVPTLRLLGTLDARYLVLASGTLLSCLATMLAPMIDGPLTVLGVSVLFTLGEIIAPQLLVDMATDTAPGDSAANAVATYNFFTSGLGLGLGLGYWMGGWLAAADNAMLGVGLWGALYAAYLITLRACHATACRAPLEQQR